MTIEQKYGGAINILPKIFDYGMFGVDLFFVISGFIMVYVSHGKFQNFYEGLLFIYHRFTRIYPAYWFYTIIVLVIYLIKPTLVNSSQGNQVDILASFLLYPSHVLPMVMVGWTLIHEVYFYLVFTLFLWFVPEKHIIKILILWGVLIIIFHSILNINSSFLNIIVHPLTLEFIFGAVLGKLFLNNIKLQFKTSLLLFLGLFSLLVSLYVFSINNYEEPQGWMRVLIFGTTALILVAISIYLEKNNKQYPKFLIKIGDASYSIYLSHILTLSAIGHLWKFFSSDTILDNIIMLPILLACTVFVGLLSYFYIEKPLLRMSRRLIT